ncbi:hypothetical protein [Deinococcus cellulosilyticus]|uniref:Apea-like HEPN domain-containing protein n=1 Tax=Deinococcus cellulosilyticus (strain DSM 18568 / NBRC 106333 / KACC 11606 / 5516J-15) TaxID=1223518 RepID=A0A511NAR9_DEIC1|nr:hypothetical protein [Deinococcus cellulosilyticus]GEM49461.1 hypothetical protein DC3_50960 [Deinococcus cellulosilyticus NBRC 106333 = KACC 11606]
MNKMQNPKPGSIIYEDWKLHLQTPDQKETGLRSYFYSDSAFQPAEVQYGPYRVTFPANSGLPAEPQRVGVFTADSHLELNGLTSMEPDATGYHGGMMFDEVAALLSLELGVRLHAGGLQLELSGEGEAPRYQEPEPEETPHFISKGRNRVVPNLVRDDVDVHQATRLKRLMDLKPKESRMVVLAARAYQKGAWIAESAPDLALLYFVTAVELAAKAHFKKLAGGPVERFQELHPKLSADLLKLCKTDETLSEEDAAQGKLVLEEVATKFEDLTESTIQFKDFLMAFLPEPPQKKPSKEYSLPWTDEDAMREVFQTVYRVRSKALHAANPIPWPMHKRLWDRGYGPGWEETSGPEGATAQGFGAVWTGAMAPINLNAFEYIARSALLAWWDTLLLKPNKGKNGKKK